MKYACPTIAVLALLVSGACGEALPSPDSNPIAPSTADLANPSATATRTYQVTIENLTAGQPLSPGVVVTHGRKAHVFEVGAAASDEVRQIAEDGNPGPAAAALSTEADVFQVVATAAPIHRIGGPGPSSLTVEIEAAADANFLSVVAMLICTNDGFTGVDSLRLPGGFKPVESLAVGYDAGTEANNELADQVVDPCGAIGPVPGATPGGNGRVATASAIAVHPGIQGGGALDIAAHGWQDPVARITVQRTK